MRLSRLLAPELKALLLESPEQLSEIFDREHPEDLADLLRDLEPAEIAAALCRLSAHDGAPVMQRMNEEEQLAIASLLPFETLLRLAASMSVGRRVRLARTLPAALAEPLLLALRVRFPHTAVGLQMLEQWPPGSAGHMMTPSFITLSATMTVRGALGALREHDERASDVTDDLYVVDDRHRVTGRVSLRELIFADPEAPLYDLVHGRLVAIAPTDDLREVARKMAKYDLHVLPVVDERGALLGMLAIDDVMDALTKETSEAVQRIGAVEPLDLPYFKTSFLAFIRKRGVWLFVLFFGEFFTQTALRHYDPVFEAIHGAAYYVPLLISAGGNSGSQSSTLVIRGMAVGEIKLRDWWRILVREAGMGLVLGCGLAIVGFFRVLMYPEQHTDFAFTVAFTLVGIVMTGCTVGAMLPILLKRIGLDPATSSTPFIASLVDVLGIIIFVHMAQVIMSAALGGVHIAASSLPIP